VVIIAVTQGIIDVLQVIIGDVDESGVPNLGTLRLTASLLALFMAAVVAIFVYHATNPRLKRRSFTEDELFGIPVGNDFQHPYKHSVNEILGALFRDYSKDIADGIALALMEE
jgi:hypothetical protein